MQDEGSTLKRQVEDVQRALRETQKRQKRQERTYVRVYLVTPSFCRSLLSDGKCTKPPPRNGAVLLGSDDTFARVMERWSVELRPNNHISPEAAITGICKADRGDVTSVLALEEDDIYFTLPLDCDDLHKVIRMIRVCLLEQVDLAQPRSQHQRRFSFEGDSDSN